MKTAMYHTKISVFYSEFRTDILMLYFQEYPKLSQAYYGLVEIITENHIDHLCQIDPQVRFSLFGSLSQIRYDT